MLPAVNRAAFDKVGSAAVFRRQYGELFRRPDTLFVIVGTDSGLLPRWVAEQQPGEGSRFLFVEAERLIPVIEGIAGEPFADDGRFLLGTLADWDELARLAHLDDHVYLGRLELVPSIGARDGFLSEYREIEHRLRDVIEQVTREVSIQLGNHVFLQRQLENLGDNRLPARCLSDRFAGRDAVLLAGGPSLDAILPWVKTHRERLTVLAVSRIAARLQAENLVPDFVFAIDPHSVSFDVSKEALRFPPRTVLVCGNHVYPALQGQWPGPVLYCGDRFPWPSEAEPDNLPMAGPTVTNLALAVAIEMGFQRIVLGGVDLCHDRQGHTHASGSIERQVGANLAPCGTRVPTNGGWLADTTPAFAQAAETLSRQAARAAARGCLVINPAPGAARMDSVVHQPLDEIDPPADGTAATGALADTLIALDAAESKGALNTALKELAATRCRLYEAEKLCEQAREANRRLHADPSGHDLRFKNRMDKIERRLEGALGDVTRLARQFGLAAFLRLGRPPQEASAEDLEAWGDAYYRVYAESCRAVIALIDRSRERIQARLAELAPEPDLAALADWWERDGTPGRVRRLRLQRPEPFERLDPELAQRLQALEAAFDEAIAEQDTQQARLIRQRHDLAQARARLQQAFERGDREELADLVQALAAIDRPLAKELHSLGRGYQAELQGMNDQALAHYQQVVDLAGAALETDPDADYNPRLEDALRRMSSLLLQTGDGATALMVLDALASLSPAYQPQYAELLRLQGRIQEAADVYTDYLKRAPGDLTTLLKLGKLFQDAGAFDSARWAYDHVLQQSPDDPAALTLRASLPVEAETP